MTTSTKEGYTISVTGHSLGGGLAQLVADVFGWGGVTFEAPGMAKYQDYASDGLFAEFFAEHPDLGFGNAADLANYTVFGSAISSETGPHIGAKHDLVTPEGRPSLAALVVESEVLPAEALLLFAPLSTVYDQFNVRHSMASLHRYVEGLSNAGLLLQTYIGAFTAYGVTGYDPVDPNLLEALTEVLNDVLNPEKELNQTQTEHLIQDLSTLKERLAFADASERDIADLQKAQDRLRIATQDITGVTIDNDHWTEQPGADNRLTVRIELEHTLAETPQQIRIELPHTDHLTGEPIGYVIDTPGVQAVTTDQGGMAPPLISHYLLAVKAGSNAAELTLRALPDEDTEDNRLQLGQLRISLPGRAESATTVTTLALGIHEGAISAAPEPTVLAVVGDFEPIDFDPAKAGVQEHYDGLGNVIVDFGQPAARADTLLGSDGPDHISSGASADTVLAAGGDDHIELGEGDDYAEGGAGRDRIEGGTGTDILVGGLGDDQLYASSSSDHAAALDSDETLPGAERDWLSGGDGNDLLVGSTGENGLSGGGGSDLIIAGAGDDNIFGDHDWVAQSTGWRFTDRGDGIRAFTPTEGVDNPVHAAADIVYAGGGDDHVWAGAGDDIVFGNDGADHVLGEAGSDAVTGGRGADRLLGDATYLAADAHGNDHLDGGEGDDELLGQGGADILLGGEGNDSLYGDDPGVEPAYQGADHLDGGSGHDLLVGYGGDDVLQGGTGNDELYGDASDLDPAFHGNDRLEGGDGTDRLDGAGGHDVLIGGAGDDTLYGDADIDAAYHGDDRLYGGDGADVLLGFGGRDFLSGDEGDDVLVGDEKGVEAKAQGDDVLIGGSGNDTLYGFAGDDLLVAGAGDDLLEGDAHSAELGDAHHGNDTLDGGAGNDQLHGGGGSDTLLGGEGADVLHGDNGEGDPAYHGNDHLDGGPDNDTLVGAGGDDTLFGGEGDDTLDGDALNVDAAFHGNDVLDGGGGDDQLVGYGGNDVLRGGGGDDQLVGDTDAIPVAQHGDDTLDGGAGSDHLQGGGGNDELFGGGGNDTLFGASGDDRLYGGAGDDILHGGPGDDALVGGGGDDVVIFARGDGQDTVVNFDLRAERRDVIQFGEGISPDDVIVSRSEDDLRLTLRDTDDLLVVSQYFNSDYTVSTIAFASGQLWKLDDILPMTASAEGIELHGHGWGERLEGSPRDDRIDGAGGNDLLYGANGHDRIEGGDAHDALFGGLGDDSLLGGEGEDLLYGGEGNDTLDGGQGPRVFWDVYLPQARYPEIAEDRETAYYRAGIYGGGTGLGRGGLGYDFLSGGNGSDTYLFGPEYGPTVISDRGAGAQDIDVVRFLEGISPDDITVYGAKGSEFVVAGGKSTLSFSFDEVDQSPADSINGIERIEFSDGTIWRREDVLARTRVRGESNVLTGTEGDEAFAVDNSLDRVIEQPDGGNDTVYSSASYTLPPNVENLLLTGEQAINGTGNELSNVLQGNSVGNYLDGGPDQVIDQLAGGRGDDVYRVRAYDQVSEHPGEGEDLIRLEDYRGFAYQMPANVENLVFTGNTFSSTRIIGNELDNAIVGDLGGGRNILDGGEGADVLIGGPNDDIYYVDDAGDQIFEASGLGATGDTVYSSVSYTLGPGLEHLVLTGGDTTEGTGNGLANLLDGTQNSRPNRLRGGAGDDHYRLGPGDTLIENPDEGTDTVELHHGGGGIHRLADYPHVENLTLGIGTWGSIVGNAQNNRLEGDDEGNEIIGGAGHDTLIGGSGHNQLYGGDGDDQLLATSDYYKDYSSRLTSPSRNLLDGGPGNDTLRISSSNTRYLWGTSDQLRGGTGDDTLEGGYGDDVYEYHLGDGNDVVFDVSGNDTLAFGEGISADGLTITRRDRDLFVQVSDGGELKVRYWFSSQAGGIDAYRIERFTFNGGSSSLTASDVEGLANGNHSPVVGTPPGDQELQQDRAFTYQLPEAAFTDPDGDRLTVSAALASGDQLPAWLDFDPQARRFQGLPGNQDVGELTVRLIATDPGGLTATDTFQLMVADVNDPPEVSAPLTDTNAETGQPFRYLVSQDTFRDIDADDTLSLAATLADGSPLPAWLEFDAETGLFSGTPAAADVGTLSLSVAATDSSGASAATHFRVAIQPAPGIALTGTTGDDTVLGGCGNDTLSGGTGADWVRGDAGDDTLGYTIDGTWSGRFVAKNVGSPGHAGSGVMVAIAGKGRSFDVFDGGDGGDRLLGTAADDAVFLDDRYSPAPQAGARLAAIEHIDAGDGDDVIDLTSRQYEFGDVTLLGGEGDDVLWASAGNDRLDGGPGNDQLDGGAGADTYVFDRGSGEDSVHDNGTPAEVDILELGADIGPEHLWFQRLGSDLEVSVIGTDDRMTLSRWYESEAYHIEQFQTAEGQVLIHSQVESLVAAMAAFDPPSASETALPPEVRDQLEPLLAANWQPTQP